MHDSGNVVFVAAIDIDVCTFVEQELIWQGRHVLTYNVLGKSILPASRMVLSQSGDVLSDQLRCVPR